MAGSLALFRFSAGALTANFSGRGLATPGDRFRDRVAQIEVAGQTFHALAHETKYRFRVSDVHLVSHLARPGKAIGIKINEIGSQRFELGKLLGQAERVVGPFPFAQAVFRTKIVFSRRYHGPEFGRRVLPKALSFPTKRLDSKMTRVSSKVEFGLLNYFSAPCDKFHGGRQNNAVLHSSSDEFFTKGFLDCHPAKRVCLTMSALRP